MAANKLPIDPGVSGITLYGLIFDLEGKVWSDVAAGFVTYATADLANYDQAFTEQGTASHVYVMTWPAALTTVGTYYVTIRKKVGGSHAESDPTLADWTVYWDGTDLHLFGLSIDGKTLKQALQYIAASTAGKVSGGGTGTEVFKGLDGSTTRLTVTTDSSGNRTSVVYG